MLIYFNRAIDCLRWGVDLCHKLKGQELSPFLVFQRSLRRGKHRKTSWELWLLLKNWILTLMIGRQINITLMVLYQKFSALYKSTNNHINFASWLRRMNHKNFNDFYIATSISNTKYWPLSQTLPRSEIETWSYFPFDRSVSELMDMKLRPTPSLISSLCFRVDVHEIKADSQLDITSLLQSWCTWN